MLIYWGGKKTRRTEQVEDRLRAALEMEHEKHAQTASATGASPTPSAPTVEIRVEAAGECPERVPPAVPDPDPERETDDAASDSDTATTRGAVIGSDVTGDARPGRVPAAPSSFDLEKAGVQIVEEMVVPSAATLHSYPPGR